MTIITAIHPFLSGQILFDSEKEKEDFIQEKKATPIYGILGGYGMKYSYIDKKDGLYRDFIAIVKS